VSAHSFSSSLFHSFLSFFHFHSRSAWLLFCPSRLCWSTVFTMLFHHLFLSLLFSFQQVAAFPLPVGGQRPDHSSDPSSDTQTDHQLDQPNKPPAIQLPGLIPAHSPTQPPQLPHDLSSVLPTSRTATAQPATVTSVQYINSYVWVFQFDGIANLKLFLFLQFCWRGQTDLHYYPDSNPRGHSTRSEELYSLNRSRCV
jgi:hypothetical protein